VRTNRCILLGQLTVAANLICGSICYADIIRLCNRYAFVRSPTEFPRAGHLTHTIAGIYLVDRTRQETQEMTETQMPTAIPAPMSTGPGAQRPTETPTAQHSGERRAAQALVAHQTGVVITVYLRNAPTQTENAAMIASGAAMLGDTVEAYCHVIQNPAHIVLSVDGQGPGVLAAQRVAQTYGVDLVKSESNRGKLAAARLGAQRVLEDPNLAYLALVDQDGDHFANELLNFIRAALHAVPAHGRAPILVNGNRLSRHRPLGYLRAEQEELCNRILLDALSYHAAVSGRPLPLELLTPSEPLPDFHSGYKVVSRATAQAIFGHEPPLEGLDARAAYRHAVEAVMVVEAYLGGARLAAVNRRTYDEQPISLFASFNRAQLAADMILWPCKRLNIPPAFVSQWLANHLPALQLGTLIPQGVDELRAIRDLALAGMGLDPAAAPAAFLRPRFV